MQNYRRGSHSVYDLKCHVVWCTKYRKPTLREQVGSRLRGLIREICLAHDVTIEKGHVSKDHVQRSPPRLQEELRHALREDQAFPSNTLIDVQLRLPACKLQHDLLTKLMVPAFRILAVVEKVLDLHSPKDTPAPHGQQIRESQVRIFESIEVRHILRLHKAGDAEKRRS